MAVVYGFMVLRFEGRVG